MLNEQSLSLIILLFTSKLYDSRNFDNRTESDGKIIIWRVPSNYFVYLTTFTGGFVALCEKSKCLQQITKYHFQVGERFKEMRKKVFKGHMVAGYACGIDFSPEMSFLASGDGDGKCYIWDWKTTKLLSKWKAHDDVCIQVGLAFAAGEWLSFGRLTLENRAGHFRYFLIFPIIKNDFFSLFYQVNNQFCTSPI